MLRGSAAPAHHGPGAFSLTCFPFVGVGALGIRGRSPHVIWVEAT